MPWGSAPDQIGRGCECADTVWRQRSSDQSAVSEIPDADGDVDAVRDQVGKAIAEAQVHHQLRLALTETGQCRSNQVQAYRQRRRDLQGPSRFRAGRHRHLLDLLGIA